MYNQIAAKPDNLSGEEWKLLQYLAIYSDTFSADAVFLKLREGRITSKEYNVLRLRQYFARLKFAGYVVMIPFAFASMGSSAVPSYQLTSLGKTVLGQY